MPDEKQTHFQDRGDWTRWIVVVLCFILGGILAVIAGWIGLIYWLREL